jgi:hypothetical protein
MTKNTGGALVRRKAEGVRVSVGDLATDTGMSERQIRNALLVAERDGWLDVCGFDGNVGTFSVKIPKVLQDA